VRFTEFQRYERYKAYCLLLGVQPAEFSTWRYESSRIPDLMGLTQRRIEPFYPSSAKVIPLQSQ
jgi:hypothetical protein